MPESKQNKARVELIAIECKGCGRCVLACPLDLIEMDEALNERGYHFVRYKGEGCTGCGNCFYACPEPYAIRVHKPAKPERGKD